MGSDKTSMRVDGDLLIARVVSALGNSASIHLVGGSGDLATPLGVRWIEDLHPGAGPLGALLTGMRATSEDIIVGTACDLPHLRRDTVSALVHELVRSGADVAAPLINGRLQWHVAAWRRTAEPVVDRAFADGVRSLHRVGHRLGLTAVVFSQVDEFVDLDTPEDVLREFPE